MAISSVSLSTSGIPGPSAPIVLDYRQGKPVTWRITTSSSLATSDFQVQVTYNNFMDPTTPNSSIYPPAGGPAFVSPNAYWSSISSSPYLTLLTSAAACHFTSSSLWPDGVMGVFLAPPAGIRLYSSASSSGIITLETVYGN